jgi:hypothetical protein
MILNRLFHNAVELPVLQIDPVLFRGDQHMGQHDARIEQIFVQLLLVTDDPGTPDEEMDPVLRDHESPRLLIQSRRCQAGRLQKRPVHPPQRNVGLHQLPELHTLEIRTPPFQRLRRIAERENHHPLHPLRRVRLPEPGSSLVAASDAERMQIQHKLLHQTARVEKGILADLRIQDRIKGRFHLKQSLYVMIRFSVNFPFDPNVRPYAERILTKRQNLIADALLHRILSVFPNRFSSENCFIFRHCPPVSPFHPDIA